MTYLPIEPRSLNTIRPVTLAKSVSSLPRPTLRPGFTRVPRWRTMMVPPGTSCPPNALNPSRCEFESRPFRELPNPFLCAIRNQFSVVSSQLISRRSLVFGRRQHLLSTCSQLPLPERLLFLLCRGLLGGGLLRSLFLCALGSSKFFCLSGRSRFLRLRFFLRKFGRLEGLAIESDLGDANGAKGLAMSAELLVLLFALVVEDKHLGAAAFFNHLADHARFRLRASDLAFRTRNGENVVEFDVAVGTGAEFLDTDHISGRHPVLLTAGADDRVHTFASEKIALRAHGRWMRNPMISGCLLCFAARRFVSHGGRPRTGPQVQANPTILASWRENGQTLPDFLRLGGASRRLR